MPSLSRFILVTSLQVCGSLFLWTDHSHLGVINVKSTAMQANRRGGGGRNGGGYPRDNRNMRHSPEYAPYQGGGRDRGRERSPRHSPYRSHARDRSASPQYGSYRRWSTMLVSLTTIFSLVRFIVVGHGN